MGECPAGSSSNSTVTQVAHSYLGSRDNPARLPNRDSGRPIGLGPGPTVETRAVLAHPLGPSPKTRDLQCVDAPLTGAGDLGGAFEPRVRIRIHSRNVSLARHGHASCFMLVWAKTSSSSL
ncbi:hypothetical protein VTN77DRAFT_2324 [Rasamsonia byssochlamydoides]|uniref:uncharacterized protein n=1 Tax=Rasamsonia byssochlamydoides TaxID=89139 RepID=UPI0037432829